MLGLGSFRARNSVVSDSRHDRRQLLLTAAVVAGAIRRFDDGYGSRTLRRRPDTVDDFFRQSVLDPLTRN